MLYNLALANLDLGRLDEGLAQASEGLRIAQANVTYWIGIIDPTDNDDWFWASASGGDGKHVATIGGATNSFDDDMSFTLKGTQAVPEPTSLTAMALGAPGLLHRRRRG